MNRAWKNARTLGDLCELTARWLEGTIPDQPGCNAGPDPETQPLVPALAALNRAGFLTRGSQPGIASRSNSGSWQRAAVSGFAGPAMAQAIAGAAHCARLTVITHDPASLPGWRTSYDQAFPVSRNGGRIVTSFGEQLSRMALRDSWTGYGDCHRSAADAVCAAWQVTVIDPEWGRQDHLWDVLAACRQPC